jgi:hypothetical protein
VMTLDVRPRNTLFKMGCPPFFGPLEMRVPAKCGL